MIKLDAFFQTASTRTIDALTIEQASYAIWGARIGYQINRHWSASLNVANLFDKTSTSYP